jgi:hypothetical protein
MMRAILAILFIAGLVAMGCSTETGCVKGNCYNGIGTFVFPSGSQYTGTFEGGVYTGKGVYDYADGRRYEGEFDNGKYNGKGIFYFNNGRKYEGEFRNNRFSGQGTMTFPNGKKYVGSFLNGQFHGKGTYFFPSGKKIEGEWSENKLIDNKVKTSVESKPLLEEMEIGEESDMSSVDVPPPTGKSINEAIIEKEYQTREEREQEEMEALKEHEATMTDEELLHQVKYIPGKRVEDNLRIYTELLRRHPENETYRKKVEYYQKQVDKKKGKKKKGK